MKNYKYLNTAIIITLTLSLFQCSKSNTPHVVVDGTKITVSDLKESSLDQYNQIETEYNNKLISLLNEVAVQKMMEKEAKSKDMDVKSYMQDFYSKIPSPTIDEINEVYKSLQSSGRLPQGSKEDLNMQISEYLKREKANELIQEEIGRLKKKYNYKVVDSREIKRAEVDIKGEPFRGNPEGKVVIVEFSDYECPFCQRAQKVSAQVRAKYGDKIKWVFKDFPLDFHQNAMAAHIAGNCVFQHKPEQYWKFFDIIFSEDRSPETLMEKNLEQLAVSLGVNQSTFKQCMTDESIINEIKEDISQGSKLGVTGTPAFFINGRLLSGALPLPEFEAIIDQEL